jgi:ubiquinone/menaquinone biosynthesis C-methylase UbiE
MVSGPDADKALRLYRGEAGSYDRRVGRITRRYREQAVANLGLRPGQAVVDVACGTGVNLPLLTNAIGPEGRVVGIDLSPEMLGVARDRVGHQALTDVVLIEGAVGEVDLSGKFDAALFSLTHDVLQSAPALEAVFAQLRPGARVSSFGGKRAWWWPSPVVRWVAGRYITTFEGYDRPWRELERFVPDLRVESVALGSAYLAMGAINNPPSTP